MGLSQGGHEGRAIVGGLSSSVSGLLPPDLCSSSFDVLPWVAMQGNAQTASKEAGAKGGRYRVVGVGLTGCPAFQGG